MNKLDSICFKLMTQNSGGIQNESNDGHSVTPDNTSPNHNSTSPAIRVNKRKNFTPRIVRLCGQEKLDGKKTGQNRNFEEGERDTKRCRYEVGENGVDECDQGEVDGDGKGEEEEETAKTPSLTIVEGEDEADVLSGRSSSNRSGSGQASTATPSSSVSPALLLSSVSSAFQPIGHQSPFSVTSSSSSNRYIQHGCNQDAPGSSVATDQQDQQGPFSAYIVRFAGNDCGAEQCRFMTSREHFHCKLCNNKLFTKKEEMLRHYKWHRKREESLAYGFMRYSASDDCSQHFNKCVHNLRQTHYHCLQDGCDKVYISTSDVQMHANSHRKQAHIAKEGFQRVKGSEQCSYNGCPFTDPSNRTTHFHCLRPGCTHSFKNKADMDKHKAHHTRDEQLTKDGFKKYMKSESCPFNGCAFSRIVNHIHCIRSGCDYVLHSTSQMYSHKRKHEKQEKRVTEYASQRDAITLAFKNAAALISAAGLPFPQSSNTSPIPNGQLEWPTPVQVSQSDASFSSSPSKNTTISTGPTRMKVKQSDEANGQVKVGEKGENGRRVEKTVKMESLDSDDTTGIGIDMSTLQAPIQFMRRVTKAENDCGLEMDDEPNRDGQSSQQLCLNQGANGRNKGDDSWKKFITRYTANDPCVSLCPLLYKDHYHCTAGEGCKMTFKSKDGVRDHAKQHEQLCMAIDHFSTFNIDEECGVDGCAFTKRELHYHCQWKECSEGIGSSEPVFRRLEHHKVHEYSTQLANDSRSQPVHTVGTTAGPSSPQKPSAGTSVGDTVKRKRGRPPKYNVLDVNVNPSMHTIGQSPQVLLTSFKLPKTSTVTAPVLQSDSHNRRGRPRTVSSPRHSSSADEPSATVVSTAAAAVALLQQQQAAQLQQQLELLRMWNSSLDSLVVSTSASVGATDVPSNQTRPQYDGFTTYMTTENCPDTLCRYRCQLHYHCKLPRCFHSSNSGDQLESHRRDFHEAFEIPEGYVCYDRAYNCRHVSCQYNGQARHFHCQKAGCSAALLKFNQLTEHTSNGHHTIQHGSAQDSLVMDCTDPIVSQIVQNHISSTSSVIRTSGIFYPSSPPSVSSPLLTSPINPAAMAAFAQSLTPALSIFKAAAGIGACPSVNGTAGPNGLGTQTALHPYTVEQQCGRPFCKLKRRLHYHCTLCNQGFSHFDRLPVHMQKHGIALPPQMPPHSITTGNMTLQGTAGGQRQNTTAGSMSAKDNNAVHGKSASTTTTSVTSKNLKFHIFQPKTMKFADPAVSKNTGNTKTRTTTETSGNKKQANYSSVKKTSVESNCVTAPSTQFRSNFTICTSNSTKPVEKQISSNDGTPMGPIGGKRPTLCADESCSKYSKHNLHYHCEKCEFWTPEATKWHVHAKQHVRMDQVAALGFQKVLASGGNDANVGNGNDSNTGCPLSSQCVLSNHSHYHCITCNSVAFNQSQMCAHKTMEHSDEDITKQTV